MKTFKEWVDDKNKDDWDEIKWRLNKEEREKWLYEELINHIKKINSSLKVPSEPPEDFIIDPDSFFMSESGVFTFLYLSGIELKNNIPRLQIADADTTHKNMLESLNKKIPEFQTPRSMPSGRYGIKNNYPILVFWDNIDIKIKEVARVIWDEGLLHPRTYLCDPFGVNQPKLISELLKPNMPENKRQELEVNVKIGMKEYPIYDLPRLLHSLPSASEEWKSIASFICSNYIKYPILKNFLSKAKCINNTPNKPYTPEFIRKKEYWPTSENNII